MCKRKDSIAVFAVVFLFCCVFFSVSASADSSELSLNVSYTAKCGSPSTFTATASGGSGTYEYYLGNITRNGEEGWHFVVDPSRILNFPAQFGYKADNNFQFTFFASGQYRLDFYVMDKGKAPYATLRKIVYVTINDPAYPSVEAIADKVAEECRKKCSTDYDRALWLHDWVIQHCVYDSTFLYCDAEGALVRGKGTCETYHRAYTMLLNRVGIKNGRMEGNGHVWTAVRMDGDWYQVDVTWDDSGDNSSNYKNHLYFGLNDAIMKTVHSDHFPHSGYESNALANHYLIRSGGILEWSDPLADAVQQKLDEGQTSFTLPVSSRTPDVYWKVLYPLAAYQLSAQSWSAAGKPMRLSASYSEKQMKISAVPAPPPTSSKATPAAPAAPEISSQPNGAGSNHTASQGTTANASSPSGTVRPSVGGSPSGTAPGSSTGQYTSTSANTVGSSSPSGSASDSAVSDEPAVILPPVEESPVVLTDEKTGVKLGAAEGVVPPNTTLVVKPSDFVLTATARRFAAFDISLESGGVKIQPSGKVQVSLPIPAGYDRRRLTVYHIADDGTKTELPCAVMGDDVTFEAEHFSIYALAEKAVVQEGAGNDPTVDRKSGQKSGALMLWIVAGIVFVAASAGGFALWRSKRRKES